VRPRCNADYWTLRDMIAPRGKVPPLDWPCNGGATPSAAEADRRLLLFSGIFLAGRTSGFYVCGVRYSPGAKTSWGYLGAGMLWTGLSTHSRLTLVTTPAADPDATERGPHFHMFSRQSPRPAPQSLRGGHTCQG
jgi:hypothetical protein